MTLNLDSRKTKRLSIAFKRLSKCAVQKRIRGASIPRNTTTHVYYFLQLANYVADILPAKVIFCKIGRNEIGFQHCFS